MQNQLRFTYFAIQKNTFISSEDLSNLREFYGSVLGAEPIFLYEYLLDLGKNSDFVQTNFDFSALTLFLNMDAQKLDFARKSLEAIGLINTYYDNKKAITVFSLQKPLDAQGIKNNTFISQLIIKRLGKSHFDFLIKNKLNKINLLTGEQYEDATTSFFDVFDFEVSQTNSKRIDEFLIDLGKRTKHELEIKQMAKTIKASPMRLEIGNVLYSNEYEGILKLSSLEFYTQLFDQQPTEIAQKYLLEWKKTVKDDRVINLVLYLAFLKLGTAAKKGERCFKLANSLIKEVNQKHIIGFDNIENYLDGKFEFSNEYNDVYKQKSFLKASYLNK